MASLERLTRVQYQLPLTHRYPASMRNLWLMNFCWMSLSMAYFGLIYNTPPFGYDVRVVYVIPGLAFGWAVFFMPYLENKFGRCACSGTVEQARQSRLCEPASLSLSLSLHLPGR